MNRLLYHGILLAERSRLDSLSSGFRGRRARLEHEDIVAGLLILGGIALAVWIVSGLLRLQERRRGYARPLGLFLALCRAHRLRWSEVWLLWRAARAQKLRDPACLFLDPERLDVVHLGRAFERRQSEFSGIRQRLFGQFEQQEPSEKSQALEISRMADRLPNGVPFSPVPAYPVPDLTSETASLPINTDVTASGSP